MNQAVLDSIKKKLSVFCADFSLLTDLLEARTLKKP